MIQSERERIERIKDEAKRQIWVTFQKEGVHKYPAALEEPHLADVSFLGYPHRHIFHFRVSIDVWHNDRDIEFIQFKRFLEALYSGEQNCLSLDYKSCEMIADDLYLRIADRYPNRNVIINVSEDDENGCEIRYNLTKPYQQQAI
jgi:hypothetical protein